MITQQEYKELITTCSTQLRKLGYNVPAITTYRIAKRMSRNFGVCQHTTNRLTGAIKKIEIGISGDLTYAMAKETLMHEMIHALFPPTEKHGYNFQRIAREVNKEYGYHVATCASKEESRELTAIRQAKRQVVMSYKR